MIILSGWRYVLRTKYANGEGSRSPRVTRNLDLFPPLSNDCRTTIHRLRGSLGIDVDFDLYWVDNDAHTHMTSLVCIPPTAAPRPLPPPRLPVSRPPDRLPHYSHFPNLSTPHYQCCMYWDCCYFLQTHRSSSIVKKAKVKLHQDRSSD